MGLLDDVAQWLNSGASVSTRLKALDARNTGNRRGLLPTPDEMMNNEAVNTASGFLGPMAAGKALGGLLGAGVMTYHGTPHKIAGKFDLSKIGTGEGAQVYGHGMYFAENPAVADSYRLAGTSGFVNSHVQAIAKNALQEAHDAGLSGADALLHAKQYLNSRAGHTQISSVRQSLYDAANNLEPLTSGKLGNMYKQDLPDEVLPKMLQWDKPLSEQPEVAKKAALLFGMHPDEFDVTKGGALYNRAGDYFGPRIPTGGNFHQAAAEGLRSLGIPGLSYFDAGSRGAAQGTRNHVIWDQNLLNRMIPQAVE